MIDFNRVSEIVDRDKFLASHGGIPPTYLGAGMMYFALAYAFKPTLAVVIGSGHGFVPKMFVEGQRAAGVNPPRVVLIDANQEAFFQNGQPDYLDPNCKFRQEYPEVEVWIRRSDDALQYIGDQSINLLMIDGDHTTDGSWADFVGYQPKLASKAVVVMHDTQNPHPSCGVDVVIQRIRDTNEWDILDLSLGVGVAIAIKR